LSFRIDILIFIFGKISIYLPKLFFV